MKKNSYLKLTGMCCVLAVLSGCAAKQGKEQSESQNQITVAEVKAAVLENAGLSEEQVRFVRVHLDTENGADRYEVEFLCETAEYDYTVDAGTGEILSMNLETGDYDIAAVPDEILPPADTESGAQGNEPEADAESETGQYIGTEAAKQAALLHAGLSEDDVCFVHAHLELDDGIWKYDIEFRQGNVEYDYELDACTGAILSFNHDEEYDRGQAAVTQESAQITADEAKRIALEYAGIDEAQAQGMKTEFDYDDGRAQYEVSWDVGRTEYACDIDAVTGEVLSFEREID